MRFSTSTLSAILRKARWIVAMIAGAAIDWIANTVRHPGQP